MISLGGDTEFELLECGFCGTCFCDPLPSVEGRRVPRVGPSEPPYWAQIKSLSTMSAYNPVEPPSYD